MQRIVETCHWRISKIIGRREMPFTASQRDASFVEHCDHEQHHIP